MVRLEVIKSKYFLDYEAVEKYLALAKTRNTGRVESLNLRDKSYQLDNRTSPLSLSTIKDASQEVVFTAGPGLKRQFTSLQNKYYPQLVTRQQDQDKRTAELERERSI